MNRQDELAAVRDQVSVLAEQVARLLEVIVVRSDRGWDVKSCKEKTALLESLMLKLRRCQTHLKAQAKATAHMLH